MASAATVVIWPLSCLVDRWDQQIDATDQWVGGNVVYQCLSNIGFRANFSEQQSIQLEDPAPLVLQGTVAKTQIVQQRLSLVFQVVLLKHLAEICRDNVRFNCLPIDRWMDGWMDRID